MNSQVTANLVYYIKSIDVDYKTFYIHLKDTMILIEFGLSL